MNIGTENKRTGSQTYQLVFKNLNVILGKKKILQDVSGVAEPGGMLALMGPSGAGKSTLLNVLAGRSPPLTSGSVCLNGQVLSKQLKRKISYVLQDDTFFANLTMRETLMYAAFLKLPDSMASHYKLARVEEIVDALDIRKCLDTIIGGPFEKGLSGGEKKRTSIACELLTNPALLMLDEPTSGLDSSTAYSLMQTLKAYSQKSKKTVVASIHQPSSQMFFMFDRILLLCDGQVAYFGDCSAILDFFASISLHCQLNYNPADFILEKVKEDASVKERIIAAAYNLRSLDQWPKVLNADVPEADTAPESYSWDSKQDLLQPRHQPSGGCNLANLEDGVACLPNTSHKAVQDRQAASMISIRLFDPDQLTSSPTCYLPDEELYRKEYDAKWPTSFATQLSVLTRRNFKQALPRILSKWNFAQMLMVSVFCGLIWFQLDKSEKTLSDRLGVCFFTTAYWAFLPAFDAMLAFPTERAVMNKERASGTYRLSAFYFAKMASELPLILLLPTLYIIIVYWMTGLNGYVAFFKSWALLLLSAFTAQSAGFFIGATIMDVAMSMTVVNVFILCSMLAGGFYVQNMPFWANWVKYLSYLYYAYLGFIAFEFSTEEFRCQPENVTTYCTLLYYQSMNVTMTVATSTVSDNATLTSAEAARAPIYFPGTLVLQSLQVSWPEWAYPLMLVGFSFVFRLLTYIVLRFLRKPR